MHYLQAAHPAHVLFEECGSVRQLDERHLTGDADAGGFAGGDAHVGRGAWLFLVPLRPVAGGSELGAERRRAPVSLGQSLRGH